MRFTPEELRKLAIPTLIALLLLAAGGALVWSADAALAAANRRSAAADAERSQARERLARISEEEREVKEKLDVYKQLQGLRILGEERRLEWADAIARIRTQRELLDVSYRIEPQRLLHTAQGKPAPVDFLGSSMRVQISLLHEEDLLRFLADLRASGNAYYSVKRCVLTRMQQGSVSGTAIQPRLRAECEIDLVTITDRAAKQ
jgi:hypothetical protein